MHGQILEYDSLKGAGSITGADGERYKFKGEEWKDDVNNLVRGQPIDFIPVDGNATEIFVAASPANAPAAPRRPAATAASPAASAAPSQAAPRQPAQRQAVNHAPPHNAAAPPQPQQGEKSPIVAGLLAIFLGGLGVHKFYLGYNTEGAILLGASVVSFLLWLVAIGFLGTTAIGVVCLIEGIIYLTKSPEEFEETYVLHKKPWF